MEDEHVNLVLDARQSCTFKSAAIRRDKNLLTYALSHLMTEVAA